MSARKPVLRTAGQRARPGVALHRAVLAVVVAAAAAAAGGCATTGVTASRVADAFAPTFARLYVRQQQLLGHPVLLSAAAMQATAVCTRGDASVPDRGAGSDWTCGLTFLVDGPGTPVTLSYALTVRPDGCYTAEDPPPALGAHTISTPAGRTLVNPLYAIDGCFAT